LSDESISENRKKGQQVFPEIILMFKNKKEVSIVIRNNG